MNNLTTEIKMTSLELAELTGKEHRNILRDIRSEIESLGEEKGRLIFEQSSYINSQNKEQPCYTFGRKGAMQLALKYEAKTRFKVIEKLEELENKEQRIDSKFLFQVAQQLEEKEKQITIMKPKAEYFDALVDSNLLTNFRNTAKELEIKERIFVGWLEEKKYIYRDSKNIIKPFAKYSPGLFKLKDFTSKSGYSDVQTFITPKGKETFRLLLIKDGLISEINNIDFLLSN